MTNDDRASRTGLQQKLGLAPDGLMVQQVRARWSAWRAVDERLLFGDFDEVLGWLRAGAHDDAEHSLRDEVLCALAWRAARDGGDDVVAGAALAWILLPGAVTLARSLSAFVPEVDSRVAAQLWIEVRSFPWRRRRHVAANVLQLTRTGVMADAGDLRQVLRTDRTWARTDLLPADGFLIDDFPGLPRAVSSRLTTPAVDAGEAGLGTADEVRLLLDAALHEGLLSDWERTLLTRVMEETRAVGPLHRQGSHGGLSARVVTQRVAARMGVSPATVKRHTRRTLAVLTAARGRLAA